jgi:toxin-antitoxin system PIN domain toxin
LSTHLLDGNVLAALTDSAHVHHAACVDWFNATGQPFATCPITQCTLLRMLVRHGAVASLQEAAEVIAALCGHPRHRFWPNDVDYRNLDWRGITGHRQITDAYLAALARSKGGRLLSLDKGLAALHPDVVDLLQT